MLTVLLNILHLYADRDIRVMVLPKTAITKAFSVGINFVFARQWTLKFSVVNVLLFINGRSKIKLVSSVILDSVKYLLMLLCTQFFKKRPTFLC